MEGGRRSEGEVRARAFLTTQKPLGAKHKCPPHTGQARERGHLQAPKPELGVAQGPPLGICHFKGGEKLILSMKPALESRDHRQGQLGSTEVRRSREVLEREYGERDVGEEGGCEAWAWLA